MTLCAQCGENEIRAPGQSWCPSCHAAYCRWWRKDHPLTGVAKQRYKARRVAQNRRRDGKLLPEPCRFCGSESSQMHHPDYAKPLDVVWVCKPCHLELHRRERREQIEAFNALVRRYVGRRA